LDRFLGHQADFLPLEVGQAAAKTAELRERVNRLIGAIWEAGVKKRGLAEVRTRTYASRDAFEALLEAIHDVPKFPYDTLADPDGLLAWVRLRLAIAKAHPLSLTLAKKPSIDEVLLPASMPSIIAGLRVSAGLGWQSLVGAELIVASSGIGYLMVKGQSNVSTTIVMSGMIAIGIVGVIIDVALRALEARISHRGVR
jgi:preprotein translocase subunit Sss1